MCANFKPLTYSQLQALNLPPIPFEYLDEVYPAYTTPLLFKSELGLEWRDVMFGLVPKWATDLSSAKKPTMRVVKPYYSVQAFLKPRLSVTLVLSLSLSSMKLNTLMGNHNVGVYVVKMDKHFSLQQFMKFVD